MRLDSPLAPAPRIDAHHHLWRYTAEEYGWLDDSMAALRRDFLVQDLLQELRLAQVDGAIAVQARQTIAETDWLLFLAEDTPAIRGVVGWLPLASSELDRHLDRLAGNPLLKGLRHVVQAEPEGFFDAPAFNAGIRKLQSTGLVYDILIFEWQLAAATRFVDRHPSQTFVLDHIAKPRIAEKELEPWRTQIRELARRPNVNCKISGMVTEADPGRWTPEQLQRYAEVVLEVFSPDRLMIGTDWPVLTVGCTYARWWKLVEQWISPLSLTEQIQILGGTATRVYGLESSLAASTTDAARVAQGEHG